MALSSLGSSVSGLLNTAGTLTQSASNLASSTSLLQSSGSNLSLQAQLKASQEQDANGAKLIALQSEETKKKQTTDVLNAIEAGKEDSTNKKISATAQNAKGISY